MSSFAIRAFGERTTSTYVISFQDFGLVFSLVLGLDLKHISRHQNETRPVSTSSGDVQRAVVRVVESAFKPTQYLTLDASIQRLYYTYIFAAEVVSRSTSFLQPLKQQHIYTTDRQKHASDEQSLTHAADRPGSSLNGRQWPVAN